MKGSGSLPDLSRINLRTRESYESTAAHYDAIFSATQEKITYPLFLRFAESILGRLSSKKILDVGCGPGRLMQMFDERGAISCGVDIVRAFLAIGRSRELRVVEASMHNLPFPDEEFDVVVSNYALNYFPAESQYLVLREKWRVLKRSGVMIFSCAHPFFMRASRYQEIPPHYLMTAENYFSPKRQEEIAMFGRKFFLYLLDWPEIVNLVAEAGFRIHSVCDASAPDNLHEIVGDIENEESRRFLNSLRHNPYAVFVVAIKPC